MARIITKELALRIVQKLRGRAIKTRSKSHDEYAVEHNGVLLAVLSIRRGSQKDLGHDYIPRELRISPRNAKLLGQCPWSREDYLQNQREKGHLPSTEDDVQT